MKRFSSRVNLFPAARAGRALHAAGGPTSASNGQGLCEACNHAKRAHRWRARPGPDGAVTTTLPTGRTFTTRPPPIATIRHRAMPPIHIEYVLTG